MTAEAARRVTAASLALTASAFAAACAGAGPSGGSDANHPDAVTDSVVEFWDLLHDLEKRGNLPHDIYAMEIGVGSGTRASASS